VGPGWLTTCFGVPDSPYVRAVGRKFLISAVARIRQPGCKVDTMLVLEGAQGVKKSSSIEALFGSDYFSDQLSDVATKDASSDVRGKWVLEWAELDNLSRAESSSVKKYVSRKTDDYRPSYGRRNIRVPRQCVFVGTLNPEGGGYLKDATGGRRFWPVRCGDIDVDTLLRNRDQLWAEAVALYEARERWWFTSDEPELIQAAKEEQAARRVEDPWEAVVRKGLDAGTTATTDAENNVVETHRPAINIVTTEHIIASILNIPTERQNKPVQMRVGSVMHAIGWQRVHRRVEGGQAWFYVRPGSPEEVDAGAATTGTTATRGVRVSEADLDSQFSSTAPQDQKTGGSSGSSGSSGENGLPNAATTSEAAWVEGDTGGSTWTVIAADPTADGKTQLVLSNFLGDLAWTRDATKSVAVGAILKGRAVAMPDGSLFVDVSAGSS